MKLLMSTDCVGGVWTYALDLCRALVPHDVTVHLATMGAPLTSDQRNAANDIPNIRLHESAYRLEWMADPWDDVRRAGNWLLDLEHDVAPDVVHLNGYAHGSLPFRAPIVMVAHSCVLSWWEAVKREAAPASWDRYRREATFGIQEADLVVAPSQAMLDAIAKHYGPLRSGRVIHNGRDASLYRRAQKESLILTAGRLWDEAKNIVALREVAADLPWPVCVAGDESSPDGNGSSSRNGGVLPLGKLTAEKLAAWFARADLYVLPAKYEPFGLSALEAALSGCALVLADIPSLREVWGDAAIFVEPDDRPALRRRLVELIESPSRRVALADRAAKRAAEYTPQRMASAYLRTYDHVLRRQRAIESEARIAAGALHQNPATIATPR